MPKIIIFASGSGSNAENIYSYFKKNDNITIACVLTNKKNAGIIERCNRLKIPLFYFNKHAFNSGLTLNLLERLSPDLIVLAGFLLRIPKKMIEAFPNKIINIHPALLPKYGGKGMYGRHVHKAVKENKDSKTGITIHYVNENYDEGAIIHQVSVDLDGTETVEEIAANVHELEYDHFPKTIEKLLL